MEIPRIIGAGLIVLGVGIGLGKIGAGNHGACSRLGCAAQSGQQLRR